MDARGNTTKARMGGLERLTTERKYDPLRGWITRVSHLQSNNIAGGYEQDWYVSRDKHGNVTRRYDSTATQNLRDSFARDESYQYDGLNRLVGLPMAAMGAIDGNSNDGTTDPSDPTDPVDPTPTGKSIFSNGFEDGGKAATAHAELVEAPSGTTSPTAHAEPVEAPSGTAKKPVCIGNGCQSSQPLAPGQTRPNPAEHPAAAAKAFFAQIEAELSQQRALNQPQVLADGSPMPPSKAAINTTISYDQLGNICIDGHGRTYQYDGPAGCTGSGSQANRSAHAVSKITDKDGNVTTFIYDDRGNQIIKNAPGTKDDRYMVYNGDDQLIEVALIDTDGASAVNPPDISQATTRTKFVYGAGGGRILREDFRSGAGTASHTKTHYVGGIEVVEDLSGSNVVQTTIKRSVGNKIEVIRYAGKVADLQNPPAAPLSQEHRWKLNDYQGSTRLYTNDQGEPILNSAVNYGLYGSRTNHASAAAKSRSIVQREVYEVRHDDGSISKLSASQWNALASSGKAEAPISATDLTVMPDIDPASTHGSRIKSAMTWLDQVISTARAESVEVRAAAGSIQTAHAESVEVRAGRTHTAHAEPVEVRAGRTHTAHAEPVEVRAAAGSIQTAVAQSLGRISRSALSAAIAKAGGSVDATTAWNETTYNRGFTGHEHLDVFQLIHMNGRVFDTNIGRFIQADIVNDSGIQGLNPYSYVLNNPFSLTDPSGYLSFGDVFRIAAVAIISFYTGGTALGLLQGGQILSGLAVAGLGGFATGYIMTGSVKGGIRGAWSAMATAAIGGIVDSSAFASAFGDISQAAAVVAQGLTSGIVAELQGGNFGSAFAAAGLGAASGMLNTGNPSIGGAVVAAIAGGTISELTGGDFANGAVSAAMSYAVMAVDSSVNDIAASGANTGGSGAKETDKQKYTRLAKENATFIEYLYSNEGESFTDYMQRLNDRIIALAKPTGYEYRALVGSKAVVDSNGQPVFDPNGQALYSYAASISTSKSPVTVFPARLPPEGFNFNKQWDMHNHPRPKLNYVITELDYAYLNATGFKHHELKVGARVRGDLMKALRPSQSPSSADKSAGHGYIARRGKKPFKY